MLNWFCWNRFGGMTWPNWHPESGPKHGMFHEDHEIVSNYPLWKSNHQTGVKVEDRENISESNMRVLSLLTAGQVKVNSKVFTNKAGLSKMSLLFRQCELIMRHLANKRTHVRTKKWLTHQVAHTVPTKAFSNFTWLARAQINGN